MSKEIFDKKLKALYHKVGLKHNLTGDQVKQLAESPYEFTKDKLDELDFSKVEAEEDFAKIKTNFIYRFIGKLHTSFLLVERKRIQSNTFKLINEKRWKK